jgi:hypothetical protein
MNSCEELSPLARALRGAVLAAVAVVVSSTQAATIWTGPTITYSQPGSDPTQPANQDRLTPNVWLTRGLSQGLFNARTETVFTHFLSPADTEWADGTTANYSSLSYTDWNTWAKVMHAGPPSTVGVNAVLHLKSEDIYLDIKFTFWGGSAGRFAYQRSTPATGLPSPTVSITNPVNNAVFAAPANLQIEATATVASGSVTNVAFFGNGTPLGSDQTAPFSITTSNLAAGTYTLTAVATAAGISATSSVVNITVVSPSPSPTVSITNPVNNAVFAAPTNVTIAATATVSSGSVTNVEFFGNGAPLGSDQTAPFSITTSNVAAGPYALTAVATAAGISATSSVVNITVVSPSPSPTVSITNPVNNAVFAAPANVTIAATATVSSGSVTNVEFFGNSNSLGSVQASPFNLTTGNLAAGSYALNAVATAAGVSATSSVVNITVVSPVAVLVTAPIITNGQFSFDYAANPGLTYVVENSSNLVNWLPVATNVAAGNPTHFTDSFAPGGSRYYRVGRRPNP